MSRSKFLFILNYVTWLLLSNVSLASCAIPLGFLYKLHRDCSNWSGFDDYPPTQANLFPSMSRHPLVHGQVLALSNHKLTLVFKNHDHGTRSQEPLNEQSYPTVFFTPSSYKTSCQELARAEQLTALAKMADKWLPPVTTFHWSSKSWASRAKIKCCLHHVQFRRLVAFSWLFNIQTALQR